MHLRNNPFHSAALDVGKSLERLGDAVENSMEGASLSKVSDLKDAMMIASISFNRFCCLIRGEGVDIPRKIKLNMLDTKSMAMEEIDRAEKELGIGQSVY